MVKVASFVADKVGQKLVPRLGAFMTSSTTDQEVRTAKPTRLHELDLLRFIAAIAVVFFHYTFNGFSRDVHPVDFGSLAAVSKYGYLGVDLFFLISGFVILMSASNAQARGFATSRISRLFPSILACVTTTTVVGYAIGAERFHVGFNQYVMNVVMLSEYSGTPYVDGVYWSLLVEIRFYVLVGVILAARSIHRARGLLLGWLALTAIHLTVGMPGPLPYLLILSWSPYFIAGSLFFLVRRDGPSIASTVMIVSCALLAVRHGVIVVEHKGDGHSIVIASLITLSFFAVFFLVALDKLQTIRFRFFAPLGALTYPLYLLHENIGFMIFIRLHDVINRWFLLAGVLTLMITTAHAFSQHIEGKMSRAIKNYFEESASAGPENSLGPDRATPGTTTAKTKINEVAQEPKTLSKTGL